MSVALDLAAEVHFRQIQAADQSVALMLRNVERTKSVLGKSAALAAVADRLTAVAGPVVRTVDQQMSEAAAETVRAMRQSMPGQQYWMGHAAIPTQLLGEISRFSGPIRRVLGSPEEVGSFSVLVARDWAAAWDRYNAAGRESLLTSPRRRRRPPAAGSR